MINNSTFDENIVFVAKMPQNGTKKRHKKLKKTPLKTSSKNPLLESITKCVRDLC